MDANNINGGFEVI